MDTFLDSARSRLSLGRWMLSSRYNSQKYHCNAIILDRIAKLFIYCCYVVLVSIPKGNIKKQSIKTVCTIKNALQISARYARTVD